MVCERLRGFVVVREAALHMGVHESDNSRNALPVHFRRNIDQRQRRKAARSDRAFRYKCGQSAKRCTDHMRPLVQPVAYSSDVIAEIGKPVFVRGCPVPLAMRSEENTSELQSLLSN